jgi:hypothetical protein
MPHQGVLVVWRVMGEGGVWALDRLGVVLTGSRRAVWPQVGPVLAEARTDRDKGPRRLGGGRGRL